MKVKMAFDFSDMDMRRLRASHKRGGKATRREARDFAMRAVEAAVESLPPAKVRKPFAAKVERETFAPKDASTRAAARTQRNAVARFYGHTVAVGPVVDDEPFDSFEEKNTVATARGDV